MHRIKNSLAIGMLVISISGCISSHAGPLNYITTENLSLDAASLKKLQIDAGAGFIKLTGIAGLHEIRVRADLEVDKDNYRLVLERKGNEGLLVAESRIDHIGWFLNNPKIDLTIEVPAELNVSIDDGSGSIDISGLQSELSIDDGSGEITVRKHGGSLNIDDGSGAIDLENIGGELVIEDGSGAINISHAMQRINIEDGSGDLTIDGATGHVTIDDGSGDLNLSNLEKGLTIIESGSGGVSMKNIKGEINAEK